MMAPKSNQGIPMARYLDGTSVLPLLDTPEGRESLMGRRVQYLRPMDIDRSGRGYVFPRTGIVAGFSPRGHEVAIDDPMNYTIVRADLVEMVAL